MKKNWVIRKSDGKKLELIEIKGDEIRIIEKFLFWTPKGSVMKPLKLWQKMSGFEIVK